jgi:hypothetical protein
MITICSNIETLWQSINAKHDNAVLREAAGMLSYADFRNIADMDGQRPDVEFELNNQFSAWHGGKCSDQAKLYGRQSYGLVCFDSADEKDDAVRISNELDRRLVVLADLCGQGADYAEI